MAREINVRNTYTRSVSWYDVPWHCDTLNRCLSNSKVVRSLLHSIRLNLPRDGENRFREWLINSRIPRFFPVTLRYRFLRLV